MNLSSTLEASMTPDDVWRVALLVTIPLVILLIGACAILAWPVLPLARQWMWISTGGLLMGMGYGLCEVLLHWSTVWRLPILWTATVAMGIGFAIQLRESLRSWRVRRHLRTLP